VRLHEKGGKEHEAPCVPKLEAYLDAYITAAGIADDKDGPLFRTTGCFTGTPSPGNPLNVVAPASEHRPQINFMLLL
jgi:hypothetical protein